MTTAAAVAQEKDRRTLVLLLLTRLRSSEIVLGKLVSSLLAIGNMVLSTMPLLLIFPLLGGVSIEQALLAMLVILVTAFWCGSAGCASWVLARENVSSLGHHAADDRCLVRIRRGHRGW